MYRGLLRRGLPRRAPDKNNKASKPDAESSESSDRLHSTDIAFKPTEDGWGYSPRYAQQYDKIFGVKKKEKAPDAQLDVASLSRVLKTHADNPDLEALLQAFGWTRAQ